MKVNVRCRVKECQARHGFTKHPDAYKRRRRCRVCGQRDRGFLVVVRKEKQTTCWCSGYWFPHRYGSHEQCKYHVPPTEQQFFEGLQPIQPQTGET